MSAREETGIPAAAETTSAPMPTSTARSSGPVRPRRGAQIGPSFSSAATAWWANRLRSLLTALGVVVGVAAVIAVVTLTQGTAALINQRVVGLGTTTLVVQPEATRTGGARSVAGTQQPLTELDAQTIAALQHVVNVSPVDAVNSQLVSGGLNWRRRVQGPH